MSPKAELPIEQVKNIGAKSALALKAIGIHTVAQLEDIGVVAAFLKLKSAGFNPSKNFLWSMAAGLVGIPYTDLPDEVKQIIDRQLQDSLDNDGGAQMPLAGLDDQTTVF